MPVQHRRRTKIAPWNVCQVFAVSCIVCLGNNKRAGGGGEVIPIQEDQAQAEEGEGGPLVITGEAEGAKVIGWATFASLGNL